MRAEETKWDFKKIFIVLSVNAVIGVFIGMSVLLAVTLMIWNGGLSETFVGICPAIAVFLGAMSAGFVSGKTQGKGLLIGVMQGIVLAVALYMLGVAVFVRVMPQELGVSIVLSCLVGSSFGGVLSAVRRGPKYTKKLRGLL